MNGTATSPERIQANRANAKLSTGPVSAEGKSASSRNSFAHGMTSLEVVLPDEDALAYDELVSATLGDLAPEGEYENSLALNVANTIWRRQRMYRIEAATWKLAAMKIMVENPSIASDADARAWIMLSDTESKRMRLMVRYVKDAERAAEKAVREYRQAIADRKQRAAEQEQLTNDSSEAQQQPDQACHAEAKTANYTAHLATHTDVLLMADEEAAGLQPLEPVRVGRSVAAPASLR